MSHIVYILGLPGCGFKFFCHASAVLFSRKKSIKKKTCKNRPFLAGFFQLCPVSGHLVGRYSLKPSTIYNMLGFTYLKKCSLPTHGQTDILVLLLYRLIFIFYYRDTYSQIPAFLFIPVQKLYRYRRF